MSKINQVKAGAVLTYLLIGLGSLISIAYTPVMLRLLGQSEFGLYNLVASVVAYLGLLNFGFGTAYVRYFAKYKVNSEQGLIAKLNGMFLIIFSVIGVVAVVAGLGLVSSVDLIFGNELTAKELSTSRILMFIMVLNIAITFPSVVFNSYIIANEKFIFQKILILIKTIINPLVMLPVLLMGYGSVGMIVVTTVLNYIIEFINAGYCLKKINMKFSFKSFDFALLKELFIFSSFIFMNLIVNQINWNVDRFIIGRFHGTVEVAVYSVAAQLNAYYLQLSTAISGVYIPRVNMLVASENGDSELNKLFVKLGRIQFIMLSLIFTGFIFFGKSFILLWAGKDYGESFLIALILMLPATIPLIQNIGIDIQRAKNLHKFRSWVYLFIAIGNIAFSIPLTKILGGTGAAIGTGIALVVGNIFVMNWYYHKHVGLNIQIFFASVLKILPALIVPLVTGWLMFMFVDINKPGILLMSIILYLVIFVVSMWMIGMNAEEKALISSPVRKILKR